MLSTKTQKDNNLKNQQKNTTLFFQPKLTINQPNDVYEQEADAVADKVMRMPETSPSLADNKPFFSPPTVNINKANTAKEEPLKKEIKEEETEEALPEIQAKLSLDGLPSPPDENKTIDTGLVQRKCAHCEEEENKLQRKEMSNGETVADTSTENYISSLNGKGKSLTQHERKFFEPRMGYDFSNVQLHTNSEANQSAKSINAHAYTHGNHIAFAAGKYQSDTDSGRRLIAHELTHVAQQTGTASVGVGRLQRKDDGNFNPIPEPAGLFRAYFSEMKKDNFDGIADRIVLALQVHPEPSHYLQDLFEYATDNFSIWEDNIGAAVVSRLTESQLNRLADSYAGRYALSQMYAAMITGSVTDFERKQANRVLFAKARKYSPDEFARKAQQRDNGRPTRVFPVRFMRVTGGDYAPPLAKLLPTGMVRVSYPQNMAYMSTFKGEMRTIGNFVGGEGDEINANEIVIIKDYERGTETPLPALALVDYANQASRSTLGKIVEVSIFAATMGFGGGAVASAEAGESAAVRFTATAIWGARLATVARVLDVAANVIGVAGFVIDENRQWIVKKLGWAGEWLVRVADIANAATAIYGLGRLAHSGFKLAKDFHTAAARARAEARDLTNAQASIIEEVDNKLAQLSREIDEEAAKTTPKPAHETPQTTQGEVTTTGEKSHKPSKTGGDEDVVASHAAKDGDVIKITKDRRIWVCSNPCDEFAEKYARLLEMNPSLATELNDIRKLADAKEIEKAIVALTARAQSARVTEVGYFVLEGSYSSVVAGGKKVTANTLRLSPDDWTHILEGHVASTFKASARAEAPVSTVFKGTPAQYLEILEEAVKNKAVIRELRAGNKEVRLMQRAQEWTLQIDLAEGAIKTFHAVGKRNPKLFDVRRTK